MDIIIVRRVWNDKKVDPSTVTGMNISYDTSIPKFLYGSVGSLYICIPNVWYWFGFIVDFYIVLLNHKPWPNFSMTTCPESSFNAVKMVKIDIFTYYEYYGSNGDTIHSCKVNDTKQKISPKQWVSELLSISVAGSLQINLS